MARSPCRPTSRAEPKGSGAGATGERSCPHQPGSPTVASAVAIAGRAPVAATVPWNRSVPARGDVRRADRLHRPCPRARGVQEPSGGRVRTGQTRLRRPVGSTTRAVRGGALRDGTHLIAAQRSKPPPGPNRGGIGPTWRLHETRGRALIAMEIYLAVGTIRVGSTQRGGAVVPRGERP